MRSHRFTSRHVALLGAMLAACSSEPQDEPPPSRPDLYLGTVADTDARVAVARSGDAWAVYVCGGPETFRDLTTWFEGTAPSAAGTLASVTEGREVSLAVDGDAVSGTVTVGGDAFSVAAERIAEGGPAGLYEVMDRGCRTGLVVPPAGEGAPQGVHCAELDDEGRPIQRAFSQVTPIAPMVVTELGVEVRVLTSDRILYLAPVLLPLAR